MTLQNQIEAYLAAQPEPKRGDLRTLHHLLLEWMPDCRLWFLDGRDEQGKVVSNPNIGYGFQTRELAKGTHRESYQVGISANTTGISVYILGIKDKQALIRTFGEALGKAKVTGYCIKFKALKDVNLQALKSAVHYGVEQTTP